MSGRAVAIAVILAGGAGGARADDGLHATGHVPSAAPGPEVAVALGADYGYSGAVLDAGDAHHRLGGDVAAAWRALPWLEVGLDLRGRYDKATGAEPDDGLVGDPRLWLRAGREVARGTWLAARAGVWLPGGDAPSVQLDATTVDLAALVTWAPAATRVGALAGFRLDRSRHAVDASTLSEADRVGLGWSDSNALLLGLEVARRAGAWTPRAEVSGELRVGGAGGADGAAVDELVGVLDSPMRVEVGVRRALTASMTLEAAADVGLSERPPLEALAGSGLVVIEPRFGGSIGLAWHEPVRARRVLPAIVATPAVTTPPPPPPPPPPPAAPATGTLRGRIVDDDGSPLPGATVRVGERTATTGDDGTFTLAELTPGDVEATIERPGHQPLTRTFAVAADADGAPAAAQGDIVLARVRPPSQLRGVIRGFDGQGLAATVRVEPLGVDVTAAADGTFTVDVPPGSYQVVVTLDGFASQTRKLTVEEEGVAIANIELRKLRP
ncbi:MAG TPA: carboxypeptidase regulatory-like domain-containing protein [Kofleriaceae bacterium]|nr:carboxypeptidase regulatory-like domain-containing protein [Kofleriaceae bacterium]